MAVTDQRVHFPDGEEVDLPYERVLQPGDTFHRGQEWRVTEVELRDDGWRVFVVKHEAEPGASVS